MSVIDAYTDCWMACGRRIVELSIQVLQAPVCISVYSCAAWELYYNRGLRFPSQYARSTHELIRN